MCNALRPTPHSSSKASARYGKCSSLARKRFESVGALSSSLTIEFRRSKNSRYFFVDAFFAAGLACVDLRSSKPGYFRASAFLIVLIQWDSDRSAIFLIDPTC